MLLDAGATLTIVGHSERREAQHESDADVRAKAEAALAAGLAVILCVGESEAVRDSGDAVAHVSAQLDASLPDAPSDPSRLSIAYEPIWAIGTGKVAGIADIAEMHAALRERLVAAYGEAGRRCASSTAARSRPRNAAEIFAVARRRRRAGRRRQPHGGRFRSDHRGGEPLTPASSVELPAVRR